MPSLWIQRKIRVALAWPVDIYMLAACTFTKQHPIGEGDDGHFVAFVNNLQDMNVQAGNAQPYWLASATRGTFSSAQD